MIDAAEEMRLRKLNEFEDRYHKNGSLNICGIDEVGRGPLAGPVVAACVILPPHTLIEGIDDSKKVPKSKHKHFYDLILSVCIDFSIGIVSEKEIDKINILNATKKAMEIAVGSLKIRPDMLFIDYLSLENIDIMQLSITKGDTLSISIAAASIVAKHTRDEMMKGYSAIYPEYCFDKNSGYGTRTHMDAIRKYGLCEIHRRSFISRII
jgi:ribonuclease HII